MEDERPLMKENENDITDEQRELLDNQVQELKRLNAALLAENDMLERFISRLDPQELMCQAEGEGLEDGGQRWRQRSASHISDRNQLLTLEQKLFVARREITEMRQDQEKLRGRYENIRDSYKASMEEAEIRLSEIKQSQNQFESRLLIPRDKPEKILQYIEDKSKISQLEKLNLKNQMLKVQEKKLKQQLQQKKEMEKAEYEEIFYEYDEQRIETNVEKLQVNGLKVKRNLSSHKEKLRNLTQESTELSNEISKRELMLSKIEKEMQYVQEEHLKAEDLNQHLRHQMTNYQAPDIPEYINVKDKHKKLRQSIRIWERKVAIAEMALKSNPRSLKTQRYTYTPANSALAEARSDDQMPVKLPNIL